jgi:hypothetical protein
VANLWQALHDSLEAIQRRATVPVKLQVSPKDPENPGTDAA